MFSFNLQRQKTKISGFLKTTSVRQTFQSSFIIFFFIFMSDDKPVATDVIFSSSTREIKWFD